MSERVRKAARAVGRTLARLLDLAADPLGFAFAKWLNDEGTTRSPRRRVFVDREGNVSGAGQGKPE